MAILPPLPPPAVLKHTPDILRHGHSHVVLSPSQPQINSPMDTISGPLRHPSNHQINQLSMPAVVSHTQRSPNIVLTRQLNGSLQPLILAECSRLSSPCHLSPSLKIETQQIPCQRSCQIPWRSKLMLSLRYLPVYCLVHVKEHARYTAAIKNPAAWYSLKSGRYV